MIKHRRFEFLLSSLPDLEALGTPPSIGKVDFLSRLKDVRGPLASVQLIFMSDDLVQREGLLAGELSPESADMAVLDFKSEDDDSDLPDFLKADETQETSDNARMGVDALWQRFFQHAHNEARRLGSTFLAAWVGFEIALRNSLVIARAQRLDLDPTNYLVTPEFGAPDLDTASIISAWSNAPDPLLAMEVLDKARWDWIEDQGRWYSFQADELEAYGAKLLLLHRWHRIASEKTSESKI